jgi:glycosyltransferase involved in cell wall biosynthesis
MHILIIPSWYKNTYRPYSGMFFKEQAELLARFGIKTGLISILDYDLRNVFPKNRISFKKETYVENGVFNINVEFPYIPKMRSLMNRINLYSFKKSFNDYINKFGSPDILHLHSFHKGEFALYVKNAFNIPYVVTAHSSGFQRNVYNNKMLALADQVFKNSSFNIAVSNEFKKLLRNMFNQQFHYIPNVVDTQKFTIKKIRNTESNVFTFLNIAGMVKRKSHGLLIKAFNKGFKQNKKIKLLIIGDGKERGYLKELIRQLRLEDQVILKPQIPNEELIEEYNKADAFVLSSKIETFGVVLIEALSCGTPVISTICGGPESIITNEKAGILCEHNEESLSNAMIGMKENIDKYDPKVLRDHAIQNFSEEVVVNKLIEVYKQVLLNNVE